MKVVFAAALGMLSGCLGSFPSHPGKTDLPAFEPERFFSGETRGVGTLVTFTGSQRSMHVAGSGRTAADGSFHLDQTVTFSNGDTETRAWRLVQRAPGQYDATLSDAAGEVSAEASGNLFHLRYLLRRPAVYIEQWLYLQSDGHTVLNFGTVTVIGIPVARLSEEIRKIEAAASGRP